MLVVPYNQHKYYPLARWSWCRSMGCIWRGRRRLRIIKSSWIIRSNFKASQAGFTGHERSLWFRSHTWKSENLRYEVWYGTRVCTSMCGQRRSYTNCQRSNRNSTWIMRGFANTTLLWVKDPVYPRSGKLSLESLPNLEHLGLIWNHTKKSFIVNASSTTCALLRPSQPSQADCGCKTNGWSRVARLISRGTRLAWKFMLFTTKSSRRQ